MTNITIPNFTPTEFSSNEYKQKFAKHFIRFVESDFKRTLFPKWFYIRLSMTRGHIAHYDIHGFFSTWFECQEDKNKFVHHWVTSPIYGDPEYTYSDVENFLRFYLKEKFGYNG